MEPHIGIAESNREQIVGIPLKLTEVARPTQGKPAAAGPRISSTRTATRGYRRVTVNDTFSEMGDGAGPIREESSPLQREQGAAGEPDLESLWGSGGGRAHLWG
ncbi:MAG: hypothetical protein ACREXW_10575 [Gammaproteobacteria bacterium]